MAFTSRIIGSEEEELKEIVEGTNAELDRLMYLKRAGDNEELLEAVWFPNGKPSLANLNSNVLDLEIQNLISKPFGAEDQGDPISRIYKKLLRRTPTPPALTVFNLIFYASSVLVANGSKINRPGGFKSTYADIWTMLLAPTGSMKTLTHSVLVNALPPHVKELFVGESKIKIPEPASGPALIDSLKRAPVLDSGESIGLIDLDEAGQLIKEIENPNSNKHPLKKIFLEMKDNAELTEHTKTNGTVQVSKPVVALRFINTIEQMAKAIGEESYYDGFMRRFNVVIAQKEAGQQEKLFPTFDLDYQETKLPEDLSELFAAKPEKEYSFVDGSRDHFDETYRLYQPLLKEKFTGSRNSKDEKWDAFIHTYLQDAWKYAVVHHYFTNRRRGRKVQIESLDWGFKCILYSLNSFHRFLNEYVAKPSVSKALQSQTAKAEKVKEWLNENRNLKNLAKETQRKFGIKADALFTYIEEIEFKDNTWLNPIEAWTIKKRRELQMKKQEITV